MTGERHDTRRQSAIDRAGGPRGHAGSLDGAVERGVELPKSFIMEPVSGLVDVKQREDEARLLGQTTDAASCLNIFDGGFGLSLNNHQPQTPDIQTYRDHIGSERHIDAIWSEG